MSGYSGRVEHEKSREAGYDHHLVKPFLPNDLDSLLEEAVVESRKKLAPIRAVGVLDAILSK